MINAKVLPQAINADDATPFLAPHEVLNIDNLRVSVSADGKQYALRNLPATQLLYSETLWNSPSVVGRTVDGRRNRLIWLHQDGNPANDTIYAYDLATNITYTVLRSSQTAGGLHFSTFTRADRNVKVAGDLLLWTDNNNEPCCINIEAGIHANHPAYVTDVTPYSIPLTYETITLIKRPPPYPMTVTKVVDSTFAGLFIDSHAYQFCYRYHYRDYQQSVLSPYSPLAGYAYKADPFNAIDVKVPLAEFISLREIRYVDICVRRGNEGKTYIIKTFDSANPTDRQAILNHNAGVIPLGVRFYDNVAGNIVDDLSANTPFDGVPLQAMTLELFKDRVALGNILLGYDTPAASSLTATAVKHSGAVRVFKSGSSYRLSIDFKDRFRRKCGAVRTDVVINIPQRTLSQNEWYYQFNWALSNTNALTEIPDWAYYYQVLLTRNQTKQFYVQTLSKSVSYATKKDNVISYIGTTFSYTDTYALALDISNLLLFGQGYTYSADNEDYAIICRQDGTSLTLKVLGQDGNNVLLSPYNIGNITNSYKSALPDQTWIPSSLSQRYRVVDALAPVVDNPASGITINAISGDNYISDINAIRTSTKNIATITAGDAVDINIAGTFKFYPQASSVSGLFIYNLVAVLTHPTDDNIYYTLYHEDGAPHLITAAINTTVTVPVGYNKLFLYTDVYGDRLGSIASDSTLTFSTTGISQSIIEIYTPYKPVGTEPYFETPAVYPVLNPGTTSRAYSTLGGAILGDSALINRNIGVDIFHPLTYRVEAMSPNDERWQSWERDLGWSNIITDLGQQRAGGDFLWSDTYIPGTKSNGLNKFQPLNRKSIGTTSGSLQKLQLANKKQEDGTVLLLLAEGATLSAYLSERQLTNSASSGAIVTTDEVIGTINEHKNSLGTIHPESVTMFNGTVWWWSAPYGKFCQYGDNGVFTVSDFKMNSFFSRYSRKYLANGYNSATHPVHCAYDAGADELLVSLPSVETTGFGGLLPSYGGVTPGYTPDIQNRLSFYDGAGKTIIYKPGKNQWAGSYPILPDCMEGIGSRLFGWKGATLHVHNEDAAAFGAFYGQQYPQRIVLPVNIGDPSAMKQVMNIALEGIGGVKPSFTVLYSAYPYEQLSDLVAGDWVSEEGVLRASFLRDRLSSADPIAGLYEGDVVTSQTPIVMLEFQCFNQPLILTFVDISVSLSSGQNSLLIK